MNSSAQKYDLIVACIGNTEADEAILKEAYMLAQSYGTEWKVLHISPSSYHRGDSKLQRALRKAAVLGAEVVQNQAHTISEGIDQYADTLTNKDKKILFIIGGFRDLNIPFLKKSIYNHSKLSLKKHNIEVRQIIRNRKKEKTPNIILPIFNSGLVGMFEAAIYVFIATLAAMVTQIFISFYIQPINISIFGVYIIACVVASIRGGFLSGIVCSLLSLLCINFFFFNQSSSMVINSDLSLLRLMIFFITTFTLCVITSGTRGYIIEAKQKEAFLNALLGVGETLNRQLDEKEALSYIYRELERLFNTEVAFFTFNFMDLTNLSLKYPEKAPDFTEEDRNAFDLCRSEYMSTGTGTPHFPYSKWYFEPMISPNGFEGILAIKLGTSPLRFEKNIGDIILSFADLSATIIDRIERSQINEDARLNTEKEKLRTMLLSSVSHDLKTPLASIIGALDVYHNLSHKLTDEAKLSLTQTSYHEAIRLDNFITNILDMAKLESGSINLNPDWIEVNSLIDKALNSAKSKLGNRKINHISDKNYELYVDMNMILRALSHLFDNISKYTPDNAQIDISYEPDENNFAIYIKDNGGGIEENMLEPIFNKYTRINQQDNKIAGTGLGLPLSRGIIELHKGTITASNNSPNGAIFKIILPDYRKAK